MTKIVRGLAKLHFSSILRARCPACHRGTITKGIFGIEPKCSVCSYNFNPESGFYLGAMALSFFITAILTVPPMIFLKLANVEVEVLVMFPFVEFFFLGTFLMFYSKVLWLHLEYKMTHQLDGEKLPKPLDKIER